METTHAFFHIYTMKDKNGKESIKTLQDAYIPAGHAQKKMGIDTFDYVSIKYDGIPTTSDKFKKWKELKELKKTDLEIYKTLFTQR